MNTTVSLFTLLVLITCVPAFASSSSTDSGAAFNENAPDGIDDFAFWLGLWKFETQTRDAEGNMVTVTGTNRITITFDGYGLHENFNMGEGEKQFSGGSVTCLHPKTGNFVQSWVDNNGWQKTFIGKWHDDKEAMILYGPEETTKEGEPFQTRLVWKNIQDGTMDWSYERTNDGGETWKSLWDIHYVRVEE